MSLEEPRRSSDHLWTMHLNMNTPNTQRYDATGITFFKTASGLMMRPSLSFFAWFEPCSFNICLVLFEHCLSLLFVVFGP